MEFSWFFRSVTIVVRFLGRFLGRDVCLWLQQSHGSRKLVHFLAFVVKVGVATTQAPQSKKFVEWNGIFYALWVRGRMWQIGMRICWFVVYGSR